MAVYSPALQLYGAFRGYHHAAQPCDRPETTQPGADTNTLYLQVSCSPSGQNDTSRLGGWQVEPISQQTDSHRQL